MLTLTRSGAMGELNATPLPHPAATASDLPKEIVQLYSSSSTGFFRDRACRCMFKISLTFIISKLRSSDSV